MKRTGIWLALVCLVLLAALTAQFISITPVKAVFFTNNDTANKTVFQDEAEKLQLTCQYPSLSSYAGTSYAWDISVLYTGGKEPRTFDLKATVPQGFNSQVAPGYSSEGQEIAAIRLDPAKGYPESIKLTVRPYVWKVPKPGEYPILFEVSSGDLKSSIKMTAIVTSNYELKVTTPDGRLNTEATAGQESTFTVVINNTGTGDLEKVNVQTRATNKPKDWTVTFKPEKFDTLPAGESKEVLVTIRPSDKTISGDYMLMIESEPDAKNAYGNIEIRVTALTPTIWGWVGVGIVVLVVLALALMFIKFGRR